MSEDPKVAIPAATPPAKGLGRGGNPPPPGRKGGFGRQKGTPNKATAEMKEAVDRFLTDPDYQDNLMRRIEAGRADHIELYLWQWRYGRPKVVLEVSGGQSRTREIAKNLMNLLVSGGQSRTREIAKNLMNLSKAERMELVRLERKAMLGGEVIDAEVVTPVTSPKALPQPKRKKT